MSKVANAAAETFTGKVSPEWLSRGVWLSEAPVTLATENSRPVLNMMRDGSERFAAHRDGLTPETFITLSGRPEHDLDADLSGEELRAWRMYRVAMDALRIDLMSRLHFGKLVAFGDPGRPGAEAEWIPVRSWFHLKADDGTRNRVFGEGGAYWYVKVIDLAREETAAPAIAGTGLPGRPTSRHFCEVEMRRRHDNGEMLGKLAEEVRHLVAWLPTAHPYAAPLGKSALENAIRVEYKALNKAPKIINEA